VRPDIGHRCGDGFISQDAYALAKAHAPFFAVYSTWARLVIPESGSGGRRFIFASTAVTLPSA